MIMLATNWSITPFAPPVDQIASSPAELREVARGDGTTETQLCYLPSFLVTGDLVIGYNSATIAC